MLFRACNKFQDFRTYVRINYYCFNFFIMIPFLCEINSKMTIMVIPNKGACGRVIYIEILLYDIRLSPFDRFVKIKEDKRN